MWRLRELVVCLVVALLLVPVQVGAAHEPEPPLFVLDEAEGSGGSWATYRLEVPAGAQVKAELRTEGMDRMAQYGYRLINADDGRVIFGSTGTTLRRDHAIVVDEEFASEVHVEHETRQPVGLGNTTYMDVTTWSTKDRTFLLAIWTAGDAEHWRHVLSASEEVTLLDSERGASAYVFTSRDFQAEGRVEVLAANAGTHVLHGGVLTLTVENVLFGEFDTVGRFGGSDQRMGLTTPDGKRADCPCEFTESHGPYALPPGEYTFHLTAMLVGVDEEVYVAVVDLKFPS